MSELIKYRYVAANGDKSSYYDDYDAMLDDALDAACNDCGDNGGLIISRSKKNSCKYITLQKGLELPVEGRMWEDVSYIIIVDKFF